MSNPTKMTITASYELYSIIGSLLYKEDKTERTIPASFKYKLVRAMDALTKDVMFIEEERVKALQKIGVTPAEDGTFEVPEDKKEAYREDIHNILQTAVEHEFLKLSPKDMEVFNDIDVLSVNQLALFSACMIDDPELLEDIKKPIEREAEGSEAKE